MLLRVFWFKRIVADKHDGNMLIQPARMFSWQVLVCICLAALFSDTRADARSVADVQPQAFRPALENKGLCFPFVRGTCDFSRYWKPKNWAHTRSRHSSGEGHFSGQPKDRPVCGPLQSSACHRHGQLLFERAPFVGWFKEKPFDAYPSAARGSFFFYVAGSAEA